ncbi:MAG TPA: hypothetical protein VNK43_00855 [Gemmatimonadales bacterium]|nr:hypothetical protein [Gemmatimonadales bacterium]
MRKYAWLLGILVVGGSGCDRSKPKLEAALAEQAVLSAQKDSLLSEVLEASKFVADINAELAKAKGLVKPASATERGAPGPERDRADRQAALERLQVAIARLNEAEAKLEQGQARIRSLSGRNTRLAAQLAEYQQSLAQLRADMERQQAELTAVIERQKAEIATLVMRVDTLAAVSAALSDTVRTLTDFKNTVYYVAGTKDELKRKGIVVEEGSKFLVFGGRRLVPARELRPDFFTELDLTRDTVLALPDSASSYRLVSRQSLSHLDSTAVRDGKVRGVIRITAPEAFWSASKYLILVRD